MIQAIHPKLHTLHANKSIIKSPYNLELPVWKNTQKIVGAENTADLKKAIESQNPTEERPFKVMIVDSADTPMAVDIIGITISGGGNTVALKNKSGIGMEEFRRGLRAAWTRANK